MKNGEYVGIVDITNRSVSIVTKEDIADIMQVVTAEFKMDLPVNGDSEKSLLVPIREYRRMAEVFVCIKPMLESAGYQLSPDRPRSPVCNSGQQVKAQLRDSGIGDAKGGQSTA